MRKIKFRGFSKNLNKFIVGDLVTNFFIEDNDNVFISSYEINENVEVIKKTIGQFTGFKEVEDKEIYEGDVITINTNKDEYGIIKFKYGTFGVEWFVNNYSDTPIFYPFYEIIENKSFLNLKNIKVIGNIFENPEYIN